MSNQETSFVTIGQRVLARPLKYVALFLDLPEVIIDLFINLFMEKEFGTFLEHLCDSTIHIEIYKTDKFSLVTLASGYMRNRLCHISVRITYHKSTILFSLFLISLFNKKISLFSKVKFRGKGQELS